MEHPAADTRPLSAAVHRNPESHRLEAIAERLGATAIRRHTAHGDAQGDAPVIAEVFRKMIPQPALKVVHTLGQAREAAQKTW